MLSDHPSNRSGVTTVRRTCARVPTLEIRAEAAPFPLAPFLFWASCILVAPSIHSGSRRGRQARVRHKPRAATGRGRAPGWRLANNELQASDTRHNGGNCADERAIDFYVHFEVFCRQRLANPRRGDPL